MKIHSLHFVLGIVGALALVACKSDPDGGGGGGGAGGGIGGTGGTGGGDPVCVDGCAAAITDGGEACPGQGDTQYSDLVSCASGTCSSECADLLAGGASDAACGTCLTDNCKTDLDACQNN